MHQQTLGDFVQEKGQAMAASLLRMTQPGLSKALRSGRQIYVTHLPDGTFEASEVRPFPSQRRDESAA